jgi:hypothetical protein
MFTSMETKIRFPDWLRAVELKLGFDLDGSATIDALQAYREGWSVDDYATEIDNQLFCMQDIAEG